MILDSASKDPLLLLRSSHPSRDTVRSNFVVLVETTQVAWLPDSVFNDSGLFPQTQLEAPLSQMSS